MLQALRGLLAAASIVLLLLPAAARIQAITPTRIQIITPEQFGAKGDGVTDDSRAFTSAEASLPSGGILQLGPKTYAIANKVAVVNGITIQGVGRGASTISWIGGESAVAIEF